MFYFLTFAGFLAGSACLGAGFCGAAFTAGFCVCLFMVLPPCLKRRLHSTIKYASYQVYVWPYLNKISNLSILRIKVIKK
ncbi:hypothetical protein BN85301430 [Paracholeplasma brassicae]|uniref:Uncharacterized protein n=1 Tax=Acholeplasma brassicae TaxID=61635 RepID=U4KSL8_9MOLU|nr:hypothetical protein BN85301430 [Paracholeplasma brassicae]